MEAKKNPNLEIGRNSSLYFAIGLNIMLFLTYSALNYKTYDKAENIVEVLSVGDELIEEIPVTEQIQTPPPPPPPKAAPEIITIVEDIDDIEETVIESSETSQDAIVEERDVSVEDVEVEEVEEYIEVPFAVIEKVPIFPGCEKYSSNADLKKCFQGKNE